MLLVARAHVLDLCIEHRLLLERILVLLLVLIVSKLLNHSLDSWLIDQLQIPEGSLRKMRILNLALPIHRANFTIKCRLHGLGVVK